MLKAALRQRLAVAEEPQAARVGLKDILSAHFRANPGYELIELARLSPNAQELLGPHTDEDCFGGPKPASGVGSGAEVGR